MAALGRGLGTAAVEGALEPGGAYWFLRWPLGRGTLVRESALSSFGIVGGQVLKLVQHREMCGMNTRTMVLVTRIVLGFALSLGIGLVAARRGSLAPSGVRAAVGIGTVIYVGGGAPWFAALVLFFVSSTLLAKVGRARKAAIKRAFEKGDTRDALQALSNGGVAAACALGMVLAPSALWAGGFVGALATANADTWATELGVLSRGEPWSLTGLRRVPRGSSGAVSPLGLGVTVLGGLAIGALAASMADAFATPPATLLLVGALGGAGGALIDSVLGATVQAGYQCPRCDQPSEGAQHPCGSAATHVRGLRWFDNDCVNLAATLAGALIGIGFTVLQ
jgi:uncharacterized protein (TIGR00297 family)